MHEFTSKIQGKLLLPSQPSSCCSTEEKRKEYNSTGRTFPNNKPTLLVTLFTLPLAFPPLHKIYLFPPLHTPTAQTRGTAWHPFFMSVTCKRLRHKIETDHPGQKSMGSATKSSNIGIFTASQHIPSHYPLQSFFCQCLV